MIPNKYAHMMLKLLLYQSSFLTLNSTTIITSVELITPWVLLLFLWQGLTQLLLSFFTKTSYSWGKGNPNIKTHMRSPTLISSPRKKKKKVEGCKWVWPKIIEPGGALTVWLLNSTQTRPKWVQVVGGWTWAEAQISGCDFNIYGLGWSVPKQEPCFVFIVVPESGEASSHVKLWSQSCMFCDTLSRGLGTDPLPSNFYKGCVWMYSWLGSWFVTVEFNKVRFSELGRSHFI